MDQREPIDKLIERSSLGTRDARRRRARISSSVAARVLAQARAWAWLPPDALSTEPSTQLADNSRVNQLDDMVHGIESEPDQRRAALRASDADREQIVSFLRQHHAEGRLTVEEFTDRMQRAFNARTFGELEPLTRDLPPLPPPLPEPRWPDPSTVAKQRFYHHLLSYTLVNAFLVSVWALGSVASGHLLFFWPSWTLLGWGLALGSHAVRAFGPQAQAAEPRDDRRTHPRLDYQNNGHWSRRHRSRSHVYR